MLDCFLCSRIFFYQTFCGSFYIKMIYRIQMWQNISEAVNGKKVQVTFQLFFYEYLNDWRVIWYSHFSPEPRESWVWPCDLSWVRGLKLKHWLNVVFKSTSAGLKLWGNSVSMSSLSADIYEGAQVSYWGQQEVEQHQKQRVERRENASCWLNITDGFLMHTTCTVLLQMWWKISSFLFNNRRRNIEENI